jgi:hypothetical protein
VRQLNKGELDDSNQRDPNIAHPAPAQEERQGKATNLQLRTIAWRYPARILDLKHEGHLIRSIHVKGPVWVYIYDGEDVVSLPTSHRM